MNEKYQRLHWKKGKLRIKLAVEGSEMSLCLGKGFFVEDHHGWLFNLGRMRSALEYHNESVNQI